MAARSNPGFGDLAAGRVAKFIRLVHASSLIWRIDKVVPAHRNLPPWRIGTHATAATGSRALTAPG
jgi:hypothetical protein